MHRVYRALERECQIQVGLHGPRGNQTRIEEDDAGVLADFKIGNQPLGSRVSPPDSTKAGELELGQIVVPGAGERHRSALWSV